MSDSDQDDQASLLPRPKEVTQRLLVRPLAFSLGLLGLLALVAWQPGAEVQWRMAARGAPRVSNTFEVIEADSAHPSMHANSTATGNVTRTDSFNSSASGSATAWNQRRRTGLDTASTGEEPDPDYDNESSKEDVDVTAATSTSVALGSRPEVHEDGPGKGNEEDELVAGANKSGSSSSAESAALASSLGGLLSRNTNNSLAIAAELALENNASLPPFNSAQAGNISEVLTSPTQQKKEYNKDMRYRTLAQMQRAGEADKVEVLFLLSPLLKEHAGDILGQEGLYHAGLGFRNTKTGLESTFQFWAQNFDASIVLPVMDNKTHKMEWHNEGHLGCKEGKMDLEYWTVIHTLGSISGADYNHFLEWAHIPQSSLTTYVLFSLAPEGQHKPGHLPYVAGAPNMPPGSATCFDVTQHLLCGLRNLTDGKFSNVHMPLRDDSYLWASPGSLTRKLDMTFGSTDYELAWNYYAALNEYTQDIGKSANYDIEKMKEDFSMAQLKHQLTYAVYTDWRGDAWWYLPAASIAAVVMETLPSDEALPTPMPLPGLPLPR